MSHVLLMRHVRSGHAAKGQRRNTAGYFFETTVPDHREVAKGTPRTPSFDRLD